MLFCPSCGGPIEKAQAAHCPHCGATRVGGTPAPMAGTANGVDDATVAVAAQAPHPPPQAMQAPPEAPLVPSFGDDDTGGFSVPDFGTPAPAPAPAQSYAPPPPPPPVPPPAPSYGGPVGAAHDDPDVLTPPPHVQADPHQQFHPADTGEDTRPEVTEILKRILAERYRFIREIGAGGMSIVYEMEDTVLQTHVAVKVLYPELAINKEIADRFHNEAVITARLTGNPYIIKVYDYGYKEKLHYIVTMFLSGKSLRDEMKDRFARNDKFDYREAGEIMIKVGKALESVHGRRVVHRDIKPGNIIFENGQPILIDFGIAKIPEQEQRRESLVHTQAGMSLGTPHYISPEEAQGLGSTTKSDIYSLGVVFYEMITGRVPFDGESAQQIMIDHVTKEPDDPSLYNSQIPSHVSQVVLKLLRKDPAQRLSAVEMIQTLEEVLGLNGRGSSAAAQSVHVDAGGSGGGGGGHRATVISKNVIKTKKAGGTKTEFSPMTAVLLLVALGGGGWVLYPMLFPAKAAPKPVDEVVEIKKDPKETEMDQLYERAGIALADGEFSEAKDLYEQVYVWNPKWREVSVKYEATKDFVTGHDKYLSGRSRESFKEAQQYFDRANKAFDGKFPFAEQYKLASTHMMQAIDGEKAAERALSSLKTATNAEAKQQARAEYRAALWQSQQQYKNVTEQVPWEAGAFFSRLDVLGQYINGDQNGIVEGLVEEDEQYRNALDAILETIDMGLSGLEEDKSGLSRLYEFAIVVYGSLMGDEAKATEYRQQKATLDQEIAAEKAAPKEEPAPAAAPPATSPAPATSPGGVKPPAGGGPAKPTTPPAAPPG